MSIKTKSIGALFVALIIILAVNPRFIDNAYNSILGRIFLIGLVIFFSMNNLVLGMFVALVIIVATNHFSNFVEGMENGTTIGEDNVDSTGTQKILTKGAVKQLGLEDKENISKKISDLKDMAEEAGIDVEAIKNAIRPKDSKTIPVDEAVKKSEEVEPFKSGVFTPLDI